MKRQQAVSVISETISDYVSWMQEQGHNTAAKALAGQCNLAMNVLTQGESARPVPAGNEREQQGNGDISD